jgi:hypothetical protein
MALSVYWRCVSSPKCARFGERELDLPPAGVKGDDVLGLESDVGAEEGLGSRTRII